MNPQQLSYLLKKEQERNSEIHPRSSVQTAPESLEPRTPDDSILGNHNESFMQSDLKSYKPENPFGSTMMGSQLDVTRFDSSIHPDRTERSID